MEDKHTTTLKQASQLPVYSFITAEDESREKLCPAPVKTDFEARWIWSSQQPRQGWRNSYVHFRRLFRARGQLTIAIAADTIYDLFLDGQRIDRGTAPSDTGYKLFDTHSVSVKPGFHVMAVLVHHLGESCATAMRSQPGLLVEITQGDGTKIVTDESWKAMPSRSYRHDLPCMMSHFGFYEECDCREDLVNWTNVDFDDSSWQAAKVIGSVPCTAWKRMIPRDIPLLETRAVETREVVCKGAFRPGMEGEAEEHRTVAVEMAARNRTVYGHSSGTLPLVLGRGTAQEFAVLDFGREVTGHLRLSFLPARDGQRLDIGYDEIVNHQGLPDPRRTYVHFADRYTLRQGQTTLEVFSARGFRYVLLDLAGAPAELTVTRVVLDERVYPIDRQGFFRCSDAPLETLYQTGLNTLRLSMLDTYVDCPSRERVMWMDSYVQGIFSSYGAGITGLWRRALYLFAQNASSNPLFAGAVKGFAPCDYDPVNLTYMMYYVCAVADYYRYSGERETAEALWETVERQFAVIESYTLKNGLVGDGWPEQDYFLDWSAMDYGGVSSCVNAIYIKMHERAAYLADALGQTQKARHYRQKEQGLRQEYVRQFYREDEGLFVDALYKGRASAVRSQLANVLAIWAGAVDDEQARMILERVTDEKNLLPRTPGDYRLRGDFKCQTGGVVQIGTPAMGYLLAHVMFKAGLAHEAISYVKKNWSHLAVNGTFAEHFEWDSNTSFCHGWSAGPVALWPQFILGVKPLSPGWTTIAIEPYAGGLNWAQGSIPLPQGDLLISWTRARAGLEVDFELPIGVSLAKPYGFETTRKGKFVIEIRDESTKGQCPVNDS